MKTQTPMNRKLRRRLPSSELTCLPPLQLHLVVRPRRLQLFGLMTLPVTWAFICKPCKSRWLCCSRSSIRWLLQRRKSDILSDHLRLCSCVCVCVAHCDSIITLNQPLRPHREIVALVPLFLSLFYLYFLSNFFPYFICIFLVNSSLERLR